MNTLPENQSTWWGQFDFKEHNRIQWQIGQLTLAVEKTGHEWLVAYSRNEELTDESNEWAVDYEASNPPSDAILERHVFRRTGTFLNLLPALGDRPIVTRPLVPFNIPGGEEAKMFISSPLWIRIDVSDPPKSLQEIPIRRPSDTWFGPSTEEGELCYASRTAAHLFLEHMPIRPHRAVTEVRIRNRAASSLLLERLKVPVPFLSLYSTADGNLWTQVITLIRQRESHHLASMQIEKNPPLDVKSAKLLTGPREQLKRGVLVRTFSAFRPKR